jgi:glutamate carboxypeptidase
MIQASSISTESLAEGIMAWAAIESPTFERERVNRIIDHVGAHLERMGGQINTIALSETYGHALKAEFGGRQSGPGLLVLAHLDTVHGVGTKDGDLPIRTEGDKLFGPGVFDMKGGLYIACAALQNVLTHGKLNRSVTVLLIPDEELGSPTSRALIEATARRHRFVLVPEPARLGRVITGRHAFARYRLVTRGRPAHAGADNTVGRSAIRAMGRLVEQIESQTDLNRLVSFSVGVIQGGRFVNVVPTTCTAEVLAVASTDSNLAYVHETMTGLQSPLEDVELDVIRGPERPLFKPHAGTMMLYERARRIAGKIGFELEHGQFGGGSDGNFTGALGIPTLDGLGVCGAGAHTLQEHLLLSSLVPRTQLLTELIAELDRE